MHELQLPPAYGPPVEQNDEQPAVVTGAADGLTEHTLPKGADADDANRASPKGENQHSHHQVKGNAEATCGCSAFDTAAVICPQELPPNCDGDRDTHVHDRDASAMSTLARAVELDSAPTKGSSQEVLEGEAATVTVDSVASCGHTGLHVSHVSPDACKHSHERDTASATACGTAPSEDAELVSRE